MAGTDLANGPNRWGPRAVMNAHWSWPASTMWCVWAVLGTSIVVAAYTLYQVLAALLVQRLRVQGLRVQGSGFEGDPGLLGPPAIVRGRIARRSAIVFFPSEG
eukprot:3743889-Rhodomonas_salina.1